jgi:hypothetical protein
MGKIEKENGFDRLRLEAEALLNDPAFVEELNSTVIINSTVDGQRPYKIGEIKIALNLAKECEGQDEPCDDWYKKLGDGLAEATANFTQNGSYRLHGRDVFNLVDCSSYEIINATYESVLGTTPNLEGIGWAAEGMVFAAVGLKFGIPFQNYQTDITIFGQGLLIDTYFMDVQFRPVPKNIEPQIDTELQFKFLL